MELLSRFTLNREGPSFLLLFYTGDSRSSSIAAHDPWAMSMVGLSTVETKFIELLGIAERKKGFERRQTTKRELDRSHSL